MSALAIGQVVEVPELPGRWSVWSLAPGPGAYFIVSLDDRRETRKIRATRVRGSFVPRLSVI